MVGSIAVLLRAGGIQPDYFGVDHRVARHSNHTLFGLFFLTKCSDSDTSMFGLVFAFVSVLTLLASTLAFALAFPVSETCVPCLVFVVYLHFVVTLSGRLGVPVRGPLL